MTSTVAVAGCGGTETGPDLAGSGVAGGTGGAPGGSTGTKGDSGDGGDTETTGGTEGSGGSGGSDVGVSDVNGTMINTHIVESGEIVQPHNPANVTITAFTPDPGGSFSLLPGTLQADGSFTIKDVPNSVYYLRIVRKSEPPFFIATSARSLDLGGVFSGRPDAKRIKKANPTPLVFNVDGLNAWQMKDSFELFSPGAGTFDLLDKMVSLPLLGATALAGATADASTFSEPMLIDGSKGDTLYVTQLVTHEEDGVELPYFALDKVYQPEPFTQEEGKPTELSGSFTSAPAHPLSVLWKRTMFEDMQADVHTLASAGSNNIRVHAEPGGPTRATSTVSPTLALLSDNDSSDRTVNLTYGNPFPSSWSVVTTVSTNYSFMTPLPGSMISKRLLASSGTVISGVTEEPLLIEPVMGPVTDIQVNGMSVTDPLIDVGTTPVVSFTAPTTGTPSAYFIIVRKLDLDPMKPTKTVATLCTDETTVTIPPEVLESGGLYYLRISARTDADVTKPFKLPASYSYAEALTHLLSP